MKSSYRWIAGGAGLLIAAMSVRIAALGDLPEHIVAFLVAVGVAFLFYAVAIYFLARLHEPYRPTLIIILLVAVLARVPGLVSTPTLSTDIYRYLWEGRVIAAGHNPFSVAPSDTLLAPLRDDNYAAVNHKELETIYPPLAQAVFALGARIHAGVRTLKLLFVLFDLATIGVIFLLLRRRRRNLNLCAVYAWNPLVIVEFSHSGHVDAVGIFFLVLAVFLLDGGRRWSGFAALAGSFLAKYLAVLVLPFFLFKRESRRWLGWFAVVVLAGYLPFLGAKLQLVSSLRTYGRYWQFNSFLHSTLATFIHNEDALRLGLLIFVLVFAAVQGYRRRDLLRLGYLVVGCSLLLSPTVYPWYLAWIVPFLCFYSNRAWIMFTGLIMVSYWVWVRYDATGVWALGWTLLSVEYVPFYLLLAFGAFRRWRLGALRREIAV